MKRRNALILLRLARAVVVIVALASLAGCIWGTLPPAGGGSGDPPDTDSPMEASELEARVAELVNEHRQSIGAEPLVWLNDLGDVARAHSQDMADRGFFSHTNPDGDDPFDRMSDAGISYGWAGENIAWGYTSAEAVVQGWLDSPGHRANIENVNYTHHGIGHVAEGNYWTHLFAGNPSIE